MRRVLQDGGFRSDWGNPDYEPIGDFKETAGDEYRIPLLKVLLREQLESRYEVANHFSTMNRARVELSAFIQNEGGAPLPEDALGTPEEQGIRAMLIATGEPPREVTLLPDKNGSTLKPLQALVGGNIETFDIAFGEEVSLYVNEEGLFTCPPNRAIFATEEMAKAGYLSQLDYSKVVEMGDFYTVLNGDIVAVGFDPETGFEQRPMLYTQKHLFQALTPKSDYNPHRHGFSTEQVKRFPELLASPVVLANSPTRNDVLLAILLATDAYDTPLIAGIKPDGTGNYGEREVETNMVLSVYSRQNFIRYFALLRDMDAFVFVSGRKIEALEDLSGLPLAENCSGFDIDRILQRPKCLG